MGRAEAIKMTPIKVKSNQLKLALTFSLVALACLSPLTGSAPVLAQSDDGAAPAAEISDLRKVVERNQANAASTDKKKLSDLADSLYQLGKALAEQRQFAEAQSKLEEALALDLKLDKSKSLVNDYMALAMVQTFNKAYEKASALYMKALEIAKTGSMVGVIVSINNSLGSNAIYAHQFDQARTYFEEAKTAARASNDFVGEAQASLNIALILKHDGKLKEAIAETEAAAKLLSGDNGDPLLAANTALNLGKLKDSAGDLSGAVKQFEAVVALAADFQSEADAWLSIGNIKLSLGQASEADAAFTKALEIYKAEDSKAFIPLLLTRQGCARADMGKFAEAEKLHAQAVQAARALNGADSLYAGLYELAYDFYLEGNIEKALSDFGDLKKQLTGSLKVSDPNAAADVQTAIALCYRALGQLSVARDCYASAMDLYNKSGNKLGVIKSQNSIAVTYLDNLSDANNKEFQQRHELVLSALNSYGDKENRDYKRLVGDVAYNFGQSQVMNRQDDAALTSYKSAQAAYGEAGEPRGQMNALIGMGLAQFQIGRQNKNQEMLASAAAYFKAAKTIAVQLGSGEGQWDAAIGGGASYRSLGDAAAAEENLKIAIQLFEKEKGHFSRDDAKTFALDLRGLAFEELVGLYFDQKRYDDALAVAERGRARAFLDLLEGRKRNVFGDNKLAVLTGSAAKSPVKPVALVASADLPGSLGSLGSLDPLASVTRGVSVVPRNPNQADLETAFSPINADAPSLDQIKALVDSHKTCAVEYFVSSNKLYIFVARPGGQVDAACQPISRADLYNLVDKTYGAVINPPVNFADLKASNQRRDKNLADLYTILVAPIKAYLPSDADSLVTIVPHRSLFLVPFAALIDENRKFFVEGHTLSVVPAIGVLRATEHMAGEREASTGQDKLLAFGNPAIKNVPGLGPLPYAEQEVKKISSLFGADRATVEIGAKATKSALSAMAPNFNVIHLATHGLIDEEHPMDSSVLLATEGGDDGILSVRDILKLPPLKAHLVTLSACQTGRGRISGDGVAGLSRAFVIAGTPSVLVSLWNVDDVMTAYQMECFYKDYLSSASKATALRTAQLKTIAFMEKGLTAPGERANPRYWAAFQLVGEAR